MSFTNSPTHVHGDGDKADMCEACESPRTEKSHGHHNYLNIGGGFTDGTVLWWCSMACMKLLPGRSVEPVKR